jgi:hypothetical protein
MDSSLVLVVLVMSSAVPGIAMLVFEVKRFPHGETMRNSEFRERIGRRLDAERRLSSPTAP